jgi:glutamate synthase domain-containing protein 2
VFCMAPAIEAINRGVAIAGAMQNTGEGGISDWHRKGGDLIWQIGTGYFGCRDAQGRFSMPSFLESVASAKVRAIEIKLSQGAKPGLGGILPGAKVTPEIARIRLIPLGRDCVSPAHHTAFRDVSSMLDFIEQLAEATGLPVGIKSARWSSGRSWRGSSTPPAARRTSSRSTEGKAARERGRSCSPITWPCRSSWG